MSSNKLFNFNATYILRYLSPDPPVLLSGNEVVPSIQTGAAGQAWFSLDKNCALHFHLMLSGMDRGRKNLVTAELLGPADYGEVPQPYDEHVHVLREFEGETVCVFRMFADDLTNTACKFLLDGLFPI